MPQIIEVTFINDDPNGIKIIEEKGWSGKVFMIPRGYLKEIRARQDIHQPGVYFLFGEGQDKPSVYIGQSDDFYTRLKKQESKKPNWNIALIFSGGLDSALIKHLESIAISAAKKMKRYELKQVTARENIISEAQQYQVKNYFDKIRFIMAFLGFTLFEEVPKETEAEEIYFLEDIHNKDASAKGTLLPSGEFIVYAGSRARVKETSSFAKYVYGSLVLKRHLVNEGIMRPVEGAHSYEFVKDYIFTSPSTAANVIQGRPCNGWTSWKDKNGKTLDENKRK